MNFLKFWKSFLGPISFSFGGGGGGSPGPTQSTSYSTNLPEYARPYVETMLGATQKQLFNMDDSGITGFKEYKPYSSNVEDYVAGFSPLQQQAQQAAFGLQTPGQIGAGSQMAGMAGMGALGTARQAGMAGQRYASQAQDPRSMQGYMSPYMQNVVDYQKAQALRDYQMGQPMRQAQAVGQGAFGGSRHAIQEAEAQRSLMSQLQGIEATGAQQAFQNAQQAQQFGANLGLQGQQAALGGYGQVGQLGSTLGGLGAQQLAAQQGIINTQSQMGAAQQAQEQSKINQAIQDYAIQQQYPLMQLGFMSNMLRGLPMQSQTTQLYQAQPSTLQQGIGLLGAGASLYGAGAFGKKEGGIVGYKEGGTVGYKYGGAIPEPKLAGMASNLSIAQLQQKMRDPALTVGERQVFADALQEKMQEQARYAGIAQVESQPLAGGGIIAFADEGLVDLEEALKKRDSEEKPKSGLFKSLGQDFSKNLAAMTPTKKYSPEQLDEIARGQGVFPEGSPALPTETASAEEMARLKKSVEGPAKASEGAKAPGTPSPLMQATAGKSLAQFLADRKELGPQGTLGDKFEKFIDERLGGSADRLSKAEKLAAAQGFIKFGTEAAPGGIGQAALKGLGTYAEGYGKAAATEDAIKLETEKMRKDLEVARRAEERGDVEGAQKAYDSAANRQTQIQTAQIHAAASMAGHGAAQKAQDVAIDRIMKEKGVGYTEALQIYKRAGLNVENTDIARAKAALAAINEQLMFMKKDDPARAALLQQRDQITQALATGGGQQTASTGVPKDIQGILSKYQ